ncbi:MAG: hypothetical protein J6Z22_10820 [Lachnospiraceae bacterium]|nr:hypothetical protein [Lachnospiraceae bacterium]
MKDRIRKVMGWRPETKLVALGAVLFSLLLLVPLYRILPYTAPWYDDYNFGGFVKSFLQQEDSLLSALQGAWYCIRTQWYAWQGTFGSIFFMCMIPTVWSDSLYFLGPCFLITILVVALYFLMRVVLRNVLGADRMTALPLQAFMAVMGVEFIYTIYSGFYWYNAGMHYVGMHSFMLLLVAVWICLLKGTGKVSMVLCFLWSIFGALISGGANFVTALQGILMGLSLMALGILIKSRRTFWLMPSLMIYALAFFINVSAPGNQVRKNINVSAGLGMDPVSAVWRSFVEAFRYAWIFSGVITILTLILLAPLIWRMLQTVHFKFRFPALVLLWSFCLYATGFTPSLYSLGHAGLSRTLNVVKITYQVLLVFNEIYWLGWLKEKLAKKEKEPYQGARWWFYPLMGVLMLGAFFMEKRPFANYASYATYHFVHTGEAYNFYHEYLSRCEVIKNGPDDVVVTPYLYSPGVLMPYELSADPQDEANRAIASWYGKHSVICVQPAKEQEE